MREHEKYANMAIERLRQIPKVRSIFLFGSVTRASERKGSDIDIALILDDDSYRAGLFGAVCLPRSVDSAISLVKSELEEEGSPELSISPYFQCEFDKGIRLMGDKGRIDLLNEVGILKYEAA